ncbi:MAG: multicopper oxidase domain-containing protein [Dehalococcoidia bacterium]|nr:multicopper oxidase domain-containing protein [Dehalococcoidia bacterium]
MTDESNSAGGPFATAPLSRRRFLRRAGVVGAAIPVASGLVAAACYNDPTGGPAKPTTGVPGQNVQPGATTAPTAAASNWQKVDEEHKAGIVNFLKNVKSPLTKGKGHQELAPRIENGVKVWDLTVDEVEWEVAPGQVEKARGYNNAVPGPILRATEGDRVRINVKNNLTESTAVHWHGILVPNAMDGVPYITQDPIEPGKSFTYEFTLRNAGSHMYHSHHNSADQVNRGLLGAFLIAPKDPASYPKYDREVTLILNDSLLGFTINGKGFPATDPIVAKKGEKLLVRWMNEGMMYHPMHLHGMAMKVIQRDGYPVEPPYLCDNIDVPPGSRMDCIIDCQDPGLWAFHCHILSHAEYEGGFFGLVTVLAIEDETFKVADLLAKV